VLARLRAYDNSHLDSKTYPVAMPTFLHTRIRVGDLDRTIAWYRELDFECVRRIPKSPQGNLLAFLQIPGSAHLLELCYQPGYQLVVPEDLMHTALAIPTSSRSATKLEKKGWKIWPTIAADLSLWPADGFCDGSGRLRGSNCWSRLRSVPTCSGPFASRKTTPGGLGMCPGVT